MFKTLQFASLPLFIHAVCVYFCRCPRSSHTESITLPPFPSPPSCTPALLFSLPPQSLCSASLCAHLCRGLRPVYKGSERWVTELDKNRGFISSCCRVTGSLTSQRKHQEDSSRLNMQEMLSWLCTHCLLLLARFTKSAPILPLSGTALILHGVTDCCVVQTISYTVDLWVLLYVYHIFDMICCVCKNKWCNC